MADRTKALVVILVLIIVVLGGIMAFSFLIKPKVTGYTIEQQNTGYQIALSQLIQASVQCQPIPIPVGNSTIHLIALECPQIQQLLQQPIQ